MLDARPWRARQQHRQALERHVGAGHHDDAAGHRGSPGGEEDVGVHTERHGVHQVGRHAHLGRDVPGGDGGHGEHAVELAGDPRLHRQEGVEAAQADLLADPLGRGEGEPAVDRDRVMDGRDDRDAVRLQRALQAQQAVPEALVVVHDVERRRNGGAASARSRATCAGCRTVARRTRRWRCGRTPERRSGCGIRTVAGSGTGPARATAPGSAARSGRRRQAARVRRTAEHVDRMTEPSQLAGQVPDVDTLTAAGGKASIGQQGNPQRPAIHACSFFQRALSAAQSTVIDDRTGT